MMMMNCSFEPPPCQRARGQKTGPVVGPGWVWADFGWLWRGKLFGIRTARIFLGYRWGVTLTSARLTHASNNKKGPATPPPIRSQRGHRPPTIGTWLVARREMDVVFGALWVGAERQRRATRAEQPSAVQRQAAAAAAGEL